MLGEMPEERWLRYATMHMDGDAELWFLYKFKNSMGVAWNQFRSALLARFFDDVHENMVAELLELRQTGTVVEFQAKFEELKA